MSGFLGAVSFLTRVPVGNGRRAPAELARSVPWFPVVGAGVGLAVAAVYGGGRLLLPPLPGAPVAVVAGLCLTAAVHEDGRWWVTRGTPPVEMEARTVRRKSSGPRRRAWCSWVSRVASRRARG